MHSGRLIILTQNYILELPFFGEINSNIFYSIYSINNYYSVFEVSSYSTII